jgi:outer membrane lipoprotein-sorting protein
LLLRDSFDKITRIELSGMTLNPNPAASNFQLDIPAGVDVVKLQ